MPVFSQIDDAILNFIYSKMHLALLDQIMPFITRLGNFGAIWIAFAGLFLLSKKEKNKTTGYLILVALAFSFLFGDILLKPLIARARPFTIHPAMALLIPTPTDFSFPSGHTGSSFASAIIILLKNKHWGIWAVILASLIAFSRLYLYVHFPSDIIAGILLGVAAAFLAVWLISKLKRFKDSHPNPSK